MSPIAGSKRSGNCAGLAARALLLFLPNIARAFFVLVMSSSAGAAIGVMEGSRCILRQAEHLPSLGDKLVLFAVGIAFFGIPLQAAFAIVRLVQRRLGRIAIRNGVGLAGPATP